MKKIAVFLTIIFLVSPLMGCFAPKFTIPDEPKFKTVRAHVVDGGICFDEQGLTALKDNIKALKDSADAMRKILMDIQKEK